MNFFLYGTTAKSCGRVVVFGFNARKSQGRLVSPSSRGASKNPSAGIEPGTRGTTGTWAFESGSLTFFFLLLKDRFRCVDSGGVGGPTPSADVPRLAADAQAHHVCSLVRPFVYRVSRERHTHTHAHTARLGPRPGRSRTHAWSGVHTRARAHQHTHMDTGIYTHT